MHANLPTTLETRRLRLRPFQASDATIVYPWMTDHEVQRYLPNGPDTTLEQVEARVARYMANQAQHGYSRWLIFDRASDEAIGDAGMLYMPATQETELGYRFIKARWGRGLATEVAQAWLTLAFGPLALPAVIAFAHPENIPSIRVMQKCGFTYLRDDNVAGMDVVVYVARDPAAATPTTSLP